MFMSVVVITCILDFIDLTKSEPLKVSDHQTLHYRTAVEAVEVIVTEVYKCRSNYNKFCRVRVRVYQSKINHLVQQQLLKLLKLYCH